MRDIDESVAFYERLGFEVDLQSRSHGWTQLKAGEGAVLALHTAEEGKAGRVELSMVADAAAGAARARSRRSARGIADEAFGRSIVLQDPNGLQIQVNEHDRELYA